MAELDFSKIFGETATSKASFTDENYLNGWGYLGSTPPPYQLFDYLQSINDKKSKYLYDRVNENDNKLAIHNTNATAHADIRAKITSDINSHNSNTSAHADIREKITSDINSHNTNATAHANIINAIPKISILAGTCSDGETIPLPDGYTESRCTIFVSMSKQNPKGYWHDVAEGGARNMLKVECYTEDRILRCAMVINGYDGWSTSRDGTNINASRMACIANYWVIGIK